MLWSLPHTPACRPVCLVSVPIFASFLHYCLCFSLFYFLCIFSSIYPSSLSRSPPPLSLSLSPLCLSRSPPLSLLLSLSHSVFMCMKLRATALLLQVLERELGVRERGRGRGESRWLEPVASCQRNRCRSCDRRLPGRCDCSWRANERSKGPKHKRVQSEGEREHAGLTVICGTEREKDQEYTQLPTIQGESLTCDHTIGL